MVRMASFPPPPNGRPTPSHARAVRVIVAIPSTGARATLTTGSGGSKEPDHPAPATKRMAIASAENATMSPRPVLAWAGGPEGREETKDPDDSGRTGPRRTKTPGA